MRRKRRLRIKATLLVLVCVGAALAQTPAFEVASVHAAPAPLPRSIRIGASVDGTRVDITGVNLEGVIATAYRVPEYQVSGPGWIKGAGATKFNIEARMPEGSTKEQMPEMLKSLLVERFGLVFHKETRDIAAWILTVAPNGPKLEPAPAVTPFPPVLTSMTSAGMMHQVAYRTTTGQLCRNLSGMFGRPVIDETALTGEYKIALDISTSEMAQSRGVRLPPRAQPDGTASDPAGTPMCSIP